MKIAHIVHHFPPESIAGCENYVLKVSTIQAGKEHEVRVYTRAIFTNALSPTSQTKNFGRMTVIRLTDPVDFMDDWNHFYNKNIEEMLRHELVEYAPDIVHIHHWMSLTLSLVKICKELSLKTVVTLHDAFVTCPTAHRIHVDNYLCDKEVNISNCYRCLLAAGENPQKVSDDKGILESLIQDRQTALSKELQDADKLIVSSPTFLNYLSRFSPIDSRKTRIIPLFAPNINTQPNSP